MRKRAFLSIALLALVLLATPLQHVFSTEPASLEATVSQPVPVMETALEDAVRDAMGLDAEQEILPQQWEQLTVLDASGRGITSLAGLEKAVNLTELDLSGNRLTDQAVEILVKLQKLRKLDLSDNQIQSISGFDVLTSLTDLDVTGNDLTTLVPIKNLSNLQTLCAENNMLDTGASPNKEIIAAVPSAQVAQQRTATAAAASIADAGLAAAIREELGLADTATITQSHLEKITELNAFDRSISSIAGLEKAINLKKINLSGNWITDLTPLKNLTKLTQLNVSRNLIKSGDTTVSALTKKGVAVDSSNQRAIVTDSTAVSVPDAQLASAIREELGLTSGQTITRAALSKLTTLAPLNTPVQNLTGLEYAVNLEVLALPRGNIQDLTPLKGLTRLWSVDLSENSIDDISPLKNLPQLKAVLIQSNFINLSSGSDARKMVDQWLSDGVTVVYEPQKSTPIQAAGGSTARIDRDNDYLSGIPLKTDVSKINSMLEAGSGTLRVVDKNGKTVTSGNLATGMKVQALANGKVYDTLTVVIYGDVNGDGNINITDLVQIQQYLFGTRDENNLYLFAANVSSRTNPSWNDDVVNISDLVILQQVLFGKELPQ